MSNIRVVRLSVKSNTQLVITFTSNLSTAIDSTNVKIEGVGGTTPNLTITSTSVSNKEFTINVLPMISSAYYKLTLFSTSLQRFKGAKGESFIEDGKTNIVFFVGPAEENEIRDNIINSLPGIYNQEPGTLLYSAIDSGARALLDTLHSTGEVGSSNYVSIEVQDEQLQRGNGPFDRFGNENVYQLLRVGSTITGAKINGALSFSSFPSDPVSLQQIFVDTEIVSNAVDDNNGFNGLVITLSKKPVIKVTSIVLIQNSIEYTYNIEQYRYGILDSKYDSENSYTYLDITDSQIKLTNSAIGPTFPMPQANDTIKISYYYKRLGRNIDSETVVVSTPVNVIRESAPAVATSFFLNHAPIIDSNDEVYTYNGIQWLDPAQNFNPSVKHPAFKNELKYSPTNLPKSPGEFSVNYLTGQVLVFGVDGTGVDGTTTVPPVATYIYQKVYQEGLDYVFYSDLNEIASLPNRELRDNPAVISFMYEDNFADTVDFNFQSHVEATNERVGNRLIDVVGIKTLNGPIKEVFRIYNETTGELYTANRIKDNEVYFSSLTPPRIINVARESAQFDQMTQSQLVIVEEVVVVGKPFSVLKINLEKTNIMSASGGFIGASFNTSVEFSDKTIFQRELYYDPSSSIEINLLRLEQDGDYSIDYEIGVVYLAVSSGYSTVIGDASYKYGEIKTRYSHVIGVNDIYRSATVLLPNYEYFAAGTIGDSLIEVLDLNRIGETTDSEGNVITVSSSETVEVQNDIYYLGKIFQITDLKTKFEPINFGEGAVKSALASNVIILNSGGSTVNDPNEIAIKTTGSRNYIEAERLSDLFNAGLVELTSAISIADVNTGINYFVQGSDGYVDAATNRIYLPTGIGTVGTLVSALYKAKLRGGAAVLVEYTSGNIFIDYSYTPEEIIISYEYGDNVLDWSISDTLASGTNYYVSYRYGAMRNGLRDNFGVLTGIEELSVISDDLERETYRNALIGSLQCFPKGPTIPSIKELVKAFTQIYPNITESIFLEWILGRDYLYLSPLKLAANNIEDLPSYGKGKFDKGLLMNKDGQTAILPFNSNISIAEGTWEAFVIPEWDGLANDAEISFDILFDNVRDINKVFIGSGNVHPETIPFSLNILEPSVFGKPSVLHQETGYFIWFDSSANKWRLRARAPISESRLFSGNITSSGEFYDVRVAKTADGYDAYESSIYDINEINDILRSTREKVNFSFIVDAYDSMNIAFDAYDSYGANFAGFDGIDFISGNIHYLFDSGVEDNKCRLSIYKDGQGFLKFRIYDNDHRLRTLSANIHSWKHSETHHVAASWKIGTIEQHDEMHLFVDGIEVPNTYRFGGYFESHSGELFMDPAYEILMPAAVVPTVGGFDLNTSAGSNIVTSEIDFISAGVQVDSRFVILEDTTDGQNTETYPYVYVKSVSYTSLELKWGNGSDYNCVSTLDNVRFTINPLSLKTDSNPQIEEVRVFAIDEYGDESELYSPNSIYPDYEFSRDGYQDYVNIYNGIVVDGYAILKTYGLNMARYKQYAYMWSDNKTNTINTKMPPPTAISKVNVTKVIVKSQNVETGAFSVIATAVGGHFLMTLNSNLDFCQPSNSVDGRRLTGTIRGTNFNYYGVNRIVFIGNTTDGYNYDVLDFTHAGALTTSRYFTSLDDVIATFTPIDLSSIAGAVEIKEALPLNMQENGGDYADVRLSVQQAVGSDGYTTIGTGKITDAYGRFDSNDIGKTFNILSPPAIAGVYTISDVNLDPSGTIKDSSTITLSGVTWASTYTGVVWQLLNTNYGDSGFANGLITLEIHGSGGLPFLLGRCWYEIDFPTFLYIPWDSIPDLIYIGSDKNGENQAGAVIDELRILNEMSLDTAKGESAPSSGRSITTDAIAVREYSSTPQSLVLLHFDEDIINYAPFYNSYSKAFRQCSDSVNSSFGQSAVFNTKNAYKVDNKGIFDNDQGTIEFWVSPILDTYNDPTLRYYIDLAPDQQTTAIVITPKSIRLPIRARSVTAIYVSGKTTNYMNGSSLESNGIIVNLGQPLPNGVENVTVVFVPITSQGDRFSIFKDEDNHLVLYVSASGVDYQITAPIYWKKNSWHRVLVEWDLNNKDNQDRLVMMVDGSEAGIIRYGTGLLYGSGIMYGQPNIWGSAAIGTASARNILADINLLDTFNIINIGADYTEEFTALARLDNLRISSEPRAIIYMGGTGPGHLLGKDLLYTSNINVAQPVVSDALTRLLLDFDTDQAEVEYLATVRNNARGIFDFYVEVIDTFELADTDLVKELITNLINRLKPAHTRAFVSFTK